MGSNYKLIFKTVKSKFLSGSKSPNLYNPHYNYQPGCTQSGKCFQGYVSLSAHCTQKTEQAFLKWTDEPWYAVTSDYPLYTKHRSPPPHLFDNCSDGIPGTHD